MFYNIDVKIDVMSDLSEGDMTHVIFQLNFKNDQYTIHQSSTSMQSMRKSHSRVNLDADLPIKSEVFCDLFPFHVVFKHNMEIISIGDGLNQAMTHCLGESMKDLFNLIRPLISFTWENVNNTYLSMLIRVSKIKFICRSYLTQTMCLSFPLLSP